MSMEPSSTTLVDVSSIIVTSYAHPIIFALSLFSILWGGIAWVLVYKVKIRPENVRVN